MDALQRVLEDAIEFGADSVEFEYVSEGLEISYMRGNSGAGHVISDRKLEREIISAIVDEAGLEESWRGTIHRELSHKPYSIAAEQYENFGEFAFRLFLKPSK